MTETLNQLVERQIHRWNRIDAILAKGRKPDEKANSPKLPVVTVSREVGSGGRIVAKALGERLGLDLFGLSIIDAIAEDAHLERRMIDTLDESGQSDVENRISGLLTGRVIDNKEFSIRLARAVETIAEHGGAVILGRGGSHVLGERADLRLRLIAPAEYRVKNLIEYDDMSDDEARERVETVDGRRRKFIRRIFDADVSDPSYHDVTIDTSRIPPNEVVELAVQMLRLRLSPERWDSLKVARDAV